VKTNRLATLQPETRQNLISATKTERFEEKNFGFFLNLIFGPV
jgi:hypothetical protein